MDLWILIDLTIARSYYTISCSTACCYGPATIMFLYGLVFSSINAIVFQRSLRQK